MSAKLTIGAVLGTVADAAGAISTTLGTATKVVNIADNYVEDFANKQKIRIAASNVGYKKQIIMETAMTVQQQKLVVDKFVDENNCADHFNDLVAELEAAMA